MGVTGATFNRATSKQDYHTPREFIDALERRFGPVQLDLAAHRDNHVVDRWYGPGGIVEDSLADSCQWHQEKGLLFLNPPFADIAPWARKCNVERYRGANIAFLVPASVGSNWFAAHVHNKALVMLLNGRIKFDGKQGYPKDCVLAMYGWPPGYEVWRWMAATVDEPKPRRKRSKKEAA